MDGWMDGWMDGRDIKSVLRFSSNSSMLTSKMCWFQIWCLKLSAAFLWEVMSISIFKIRKIKSDFRLGKWLKKFQILRPYPLTAGVHQLTFFSLRGPAKALHQRAPKARVGVGRGPGGVQFTGGFLPFWKPENVLFDGTGGTGGTGWTGWTGYQKCPLKFFILCVYIDKVYTYLYTK